MRGSEVTYLMTKLRKVYPPIDGGQSWIDALEHQAYPIAAAAVARLVQHPLKSLTPTGLMDAIEAEAIRLLDAAAAKRELDVDRDPVRRGPIASKDVAREGLATARAVLAGIQPPPVLEEPHTIFTPNLLDFEPEAAFVDAAAADGVATIAPEPQTAST